MKRIEENWEAIEEIEDRVKEKTGDPEAGFNADTFFFGEGGRKLMIRCMYRKPKKDGFTQKYYEMNVFAKYCPFTGKPLYEETETKK